MTAFRSESCDGERCFCGATADAKVGEEIMHDDPHQNRHNLTSYVCRAHFNQIFKRSRVESDEIDRALVNAIDDAEHWQEKAEHEGEADVAATFAKDVATLKALRSGFTLTSPEQFTVDEIRKRIEGDPSPYAGWCRGLLAVIDRLRASHPVVSGSPDAELDQLKAMGEPHSVEALVERLMDACAAVANRRHERASLSELTDAQEERRRAKHLLIAAARRIAGSPVSEPRMHTWPDGQVREEEPYRCGAFVCATGEQCVKWSDHEGPCSFASDPENAPNPGKFQGGVRHEGDAEPQSPQRCPFCGGEATVVRDDDDTWFVGCTGWKIGTCVASAHVIDGEGTKEDAIALWNRRNPSQREEDGREPSRKCEHGCWVCEVCIGEEVIAERNAASPSTPAGTEQVPLVMACNHCGRQPTIDVRLGELCASCGVGGFTMVDRQRAERCVHGTYPRTACEHCARHLAPAGTTETKE